MSLPSARSISFNRRLSAAWLKEGMRLRAEGVGGDDWVNEMRIVVSADVSGRDSIQKSLRYLRHALIEPGEMEPLRADAIQLFHGARDPDKDRVLAWGLASACYPFLHEVASTIGRMLRVQPEMKLEQLLRKLTESFGEKETVRRSGRYSLGLIQDLGFVRRTTKAGCYTATPTVNVIDPKLASWLIRAWFFAVQSTGPMDRIALANHPSLFAFDGPKLVASAIKEEVLIVDKLSLSQDTVRLAR